MTSALITAENLGMAFGDNTVFSGLDFLVQETGTSGITGESGSGKTTLARLLMGRETPTEGGVSWSRDLTFAPLFAEDRLLNHRTVGQNFDYVSVDRQQAERILHELGLPNILGLYPSELSTGMARRVAFTRAYCHPADVLVLDEPFRGVDVENRKRLADLIHMRAQAAPVILIDHDITLVQSLSTTVLNLEK